MRDQSLDSVESPESRGKSAKNNRSNLKGRGAFEVYSHIAGLPAGNNQREAAPQYKIEGIKMKTKKMQENNIQLRKTIENVDENNHKIAKHVTELKKKTMQAENDKVELLRDLATYEANFAN